MNGQQTVAYFITPHGFGHAARACAVMSALSSRIPGIHFQIYTLVPEWFFRESHLENYTYNPLLTDIGLVQKTSMLEDLDATIEKLGLLYPPQPETVNYLAKEIKQSRCRAVICDISPLGIAVARSAGLPSVVVENFTWDWIYENYLDEKPEFGGYISVLRDLLHQADIHIQTTPVCKPNKPDLTTLPVSRPVLSSREAIRDKLKIRFDDPAILVTMGGIETGFETLDQFNSYPEAIFVIPGASRHFERQGNIITLPHHSGFYHPDLLNACDVVIGKLGYSTLAEVYSSGIPFGFIPREKFRESKPLIAFALAEMSGLLITEESFRSGYWLVELPRLLAKPRLNHNRTNGARQIADFLIALRWFR